MTIKIIDLLNKNANGEYPVFKWDNMVWKHDGEFYRNGTIILDEYANITTCLNETVKIIEDNDKTDEETKPITKESIEALGYACGEIQKCFTSGWTKALENKPLKGNDKLEKIKIMGEKIKTFYDGDTHFVRTNSKDRHFYIPILNKIMDHINKIEEKLDER